MTIVVTPHKDSGSPQVALSRHWEWYIGDHTPDHILSGFTLSTVASLNLPVAAGECYLGGYHVEDASAGTVAVTDAATNHIYIQLTRSGSDVTGASLVANTTGTAPADSIKLGTATASGGQVTAVTDVRPLRSDIKAYPIAKVSSAPADSPDKELTNLYVRQTDSVNNDIYAKLKRADTQTEILLSGNIVPINLDDTDGSSVSQDTTEQISKSYTLPANNYRKIIVMTTVLSDVQTGGSSNKTVSYVVSIGSSTKTYTGAFVTRAGTDDMRVKNTATVIFSAVQTSSATIKVSIAAAGSADTDKVIACRNLHVYGVL